MEDKIIVIGSGLAGLFFALSISEHKKVLVLSKKESLETNTNYAQGGIAAVQDAQDSTQNHIDDTLKAGKGLGHQKAVRIMIEQGPGLVRKLFRTGVEFTMVNGSPELWMEGGHTRKRIWHCFDRTGESIETTLLKAVMSHPNIEVRDQSLVWDLWIEQGCCQGVILYDSSLKNFYVEPAQAVLVATGGVGQVYRYTTNSRISTGDGIAMAYRGEAEIANMEFTQFHPTSLYEPDAHLKEKSFLISEAVRGNGAVLVSQDGLEIMKGKHPKESLAPRDIIAREIDSYIKKHNQNFVYLDLSKMDIENIDQKFPNIYQGCLSRGIDIKKQNIPVVPAAHYICGGIKIDVDGRTNIENLFAAGEAAFTGVHGANRLASNSLLEALVFSKRAADTVLSVEFKRPSGVGKPNIKYLSPDKATAKQFKTLVKNILWEYGGIVRNKQGLEKGLEELEKLDQKIKEKSNSISSNGLELKNMMIIGKLILASALQRKESRGLHYRTDFPDTDKNYEQDTICTIHQERRNDES